MKSRIIIHTVRYNDVPYGVWRAVDDLAFLRLTTPVTDARILKFSQTLPLPDSIVWSAGYGYGLPLKYREGQRCQVFKEDLSLSISCGITCFGGDSGSPLFNGQNEVVGVIISTETEKDSFGGYALNDSGSIVPVMRSLPVKTYELATYAYRLDCAQYLCTKQASLKAFLHLNRLPKEVMLDSSLCMWTQKGSIQVKMVLPKSFDDPIEVDCTKLLGDLDNGVLDLKELRVQVSCAVTDVEIPEFKLKEIELFVSSPQSSAYRVKVTVVNDKKWFKVNEIHVFQLKKNLPEQRTVVSQIEVQLPN